MVKNNFILGNLALKEPGMQRRNVSTIKIIDSFMFKRISNSEVKAKIVDIRDRSKYKISHIKNAISIPYNTICKNTQHLFEKDDTIIFYSNYEESHLCLEVANFFLSLNYKNVFVYIEEDSNFEEEMLLEDVVISGFI